MAANMAVAVGLSFGPWPAHRLVCPGAAAPRRQYPPFGERSRKWRLPDDGLSVQPLHIGEQWHGPRYGRVRPLVGGFP